MEMRSNIKVYVTRFDCFRTLKCFLTLTRNGCFSKVFEFSSFSVFLQFNCNEPIRQANGMLIKQKIENAEMVPIHSNELMSFTVKGGKTNIPKPVPLSAMPVAKPLCK